MNTEIPAAHTEPAVDLHTHSTCSDGTLSPEELVALAAKKGLAAIALTDHDTTAGVQRAIDAAEGTGVEVIPGVELSTEYNGADVHIVGLFPDYQHPDFVCAIREFADARIYRNQKMCALMQADGIPLSYEELEAAFPDTVITRAHVGQLLLKKGIVSSISEAFKHYIGDDCPYFVPRERISPQKAVRFLLQYHALPILAHPLQYHLGDEGLRQLIVSLKAEGLAGIEIYYNNHRPADTQYLAGLAREYGLTPSGGSDFHGERKPGIDLGTGYGHLYIPGHILTDLRRRLFGTDEHTRLFFADFDGTLSTSEKTLSPATQQVLEKWRAAGNRMILCTGRIPADLHRKAHRLALDRPGDFLIGCNGGEIYDCGRDRILRSRGFSKETLRRIFAAAASVPCYVHTYSGGTLVSPYAEHRRELDFYRRTVEMPAKVSADWEPLITSSPAKCIAISLDDHKPLERLKEALEDVEGVTTFYSSPLYMEIVPEGVSKGAGLLWLSHWLGVPVEHTVAAGDSDNDLPMIREAGIGISMKNGVELNPRMAEDADVITKEDNDHDGLVPVLEQILHRQAQERAQG